MDVKCLSLFLLMYIIYVLCAIEINRLNRLNRLVRASTSNEALLSKFVKKIWYDKHSVKHYSY